MFRAAELPYRASSNRILLGVHYQEARNAYFGGSRLTNSREAEFMQ